MDNYNIPPIRSKNKCINTFFFAACAAVRDILLIASFFPRAALFFFFSFLFLIYIYIFFANHCPLATKTVCSPSTIFASVVTTISYPESSGYLVSGWVSGETLDSLIGCSVTACIVLTSQDKSFVVFIHGEPGSKDLTYKQFMKGQA